MDIQLTLTGGADRVLGRFLTHPVCVFAAIPFDADNLACTLTFCVHDDEQLSDFGAGPTPVKVDFELASLVWPLAVDEPLVLHFLRGVAKIERVHLRRGKEDVP